jgi:hypothetical protein
MRRDIAANLPDPGDSFKQRPGIQIDGKNLRALFGKAKGNRPAIAPAGAYAARARHNGYLVVQTSCHEDLLCIE